jgi:hypothetical protein
MVNDKTVRVDVYKVTMDIDTLNRHTFERFFTGW